MVEPISFDVECLTIELAKVNISFLEIKKRKNYVYY